LSQSPWNTDTKILKIGLQGKNIPTLDLPASNLVFLIDVSGSMSDANKLPLLKQSMKILVNELRAKDKVSIVVYAGAAGLVLPPTSGDEKETINNALENSTQEEVQQVAKASRLLIKLRQKTSSKEATTE